MGECSSCSVHSSRRLSNSCLNTRVPETSAGPSKLPANRISKCHVPASMRSMPRAGTSFAAASGAADGCSCRATRWPPCAPSPDAAPLSSTTIAAATLPARILVTDVLRTLGYGPQVQGPCLSGDVANTRPDGGLGARPQRRIVSNSCKLRRVLRLGPRETCPSLLAFVSLTPCPPLSCRERGNGGPGSKHSADQS